MKYEEIEEERIVHSKLELDEEEEIGFGKVAIKKVKYPKLYVRKVQ